MIAVNCEQGSPEWHELRSGIPSASHFSRVITNTLKDGHYKRSASSVGYVNELIASNLGFKKETYSSKLMERGIEVENNARDMYELMTGAEMSQVGLCYKDKDKLFSASPDSLVGDDGLLEIKCPTPGVHIEYVLSGELPGVYRQQVLGQLFVTGRKWCDFMSYHPEIEPPNDVFIIRVYPDKDFFADLELALIDVSERVQAGLNKLRGQDE